MADNSAFISYRRGDGYPWARLIWEDLQDRSINAFLDLESMRQAGRFDERILNQIAARPYFLMVLAEGSLDRCASATDWVRREIEHAIETRRTIVPLFIAPFETSHFPLDLPPHIGEALANSNGVTFYSQFLEAALDQLAAFLKPVAVAMGELTDDDAEFEQRAISRVRAQPPPTVPITPDVETLATEPPSSAVADGPTTRPVGGDLASVQTAQDEPRPGVIPVEPTPGTPSRRKRIVIASAAAVALVIAGIVALTFLGGDDDDASAGTTDPDSSAETDDEPRATTTAPERRTVLQPNEWLEAGQSIATEDGDLELLMHPGGWLELKLHGDVIWDEGRGSAIPGAAAVMGEDGNFVLYRSRSEAESGPPPPGASLFSSRTQGNRGAVLELRRNGDDAHVAVVLAGRELWSEPGPQRGPAEPSVVTTESPSSSTSSPSTTSSSPSTSVVTSLP